MMVLIFLILRIVKSRTASLLFIIFSLITGVILILASLLSLAGIYEGAAKIIFSWPAGLSGLALCFFSFIMFFGNFSRLLENSSKIPGEKAKNLYSIPKTSP